MTILSGTAIFATWSVVIMSLLSVAKSQVIPSSYITFDGVIVSVNGSNATGHCSSVSREGFFLTCTVPTSSVLFDGVIPTLTGLDGDMWASQLLTLQTETRQRTSVTFRFTDIVLLGKLEVVMFNCPGMGISASTIEFEDSTLLIVGITSCDSLVRVCTPIKATQTSIILHFVNNASSDMVYLAEVTFYNNSDSTCSPDTIIITTPPSTSVVPATTSDDTTETDNQTTSMTTTTPPNTSGITSVIIPVVVVICVVFMLVGIMAAVLIQWRYRKHKTSHHIALGEGHSHAHTHSHPPPVKMCEETGQVYYSSPGEALGQLSPSHDTYSHLQRDTSGRGGAQSHEGIGEYSTLSHANSPHVLGGGGDQLYAQVDDTRVTTTHPHTSEADAAMDQLYAQVDEKKDGISTHPHTSIAADTLYAQVDKKKKKKKKKGAHPHIEVADEDIDQLYSRVDKKKKKGEVATQPHRAVPDEDIDQLYSRVDKKKKKGEGHTTEAGTPMDQLYAQVDKKAKKKKGEVAAHPHTPEADTSMDQLYAQVDKKKKST